jgi:hypothetical protein
MNDEFVTLATFGNALEAEMARNRLEAEGIRALILDRETASMAWHLTQAIGGVKLLVAPADEDRAALILDHPAERLDRSEADAIVSQEDLDKVAPLSPDEPDEPPTERELNAGRAFKTQVFAFLIMPLQVLALYFIVKVFLSEERLNGRPRRAFLWTLGLHVFNWLFIMVMYSVLARSR